MKKTLISFNKMETIGSHFRESHNNISGFLVCLLILAGSLGSCAPLIPGILIAGEPESDANRNALEIKDGPALMAKFGFIRDIAVDKHGNVYVYDAEPTPALQPEPYLLTKSLIRKISSSGQVTTLAGKRGDIQGSFYPEPLIGNQEIDVDEEQLYFSNPGCVMRASLDPDSNNQKPELFFGKCLNVEDIEYQISLNDPKVNTSNPECLTLVKSQSNSDYQKSETIFGKCLSSEDIDKLRERPKFDISRLNIALMMINSQHNVYVASANPLTNQSEFYVIHPDGKFTKIENLGIAGYEAVNSQGHFYLVQPGLPGPGQPGTSAIRKFDIEGNEPDIPGVRNLINPQVALAVDHQDNLYLFDENFIKRLSPTGQLEILGKSPKIQFRNIAINPQGTVIYLADLTSVYKLALSQTSGGTP